MSDSDLVVVVQSPDLVVAVEANDIAVVFSTTQGPAGPPGATGATGATGAAGTNGTNGTNGTGTGDVVGPASSTADSLARFSGTTGKLLKDGAVIGTDVQAYDAELAAIAGLVSAADKVPYFTGLGTAALATLTTVARTLIAQTTQALMRTTGLGLTATGDSLATAASASAARTTLGSTTVGDAVFIAANAAAARTAIGTVIGTDVQAQDAELAALAGLTSAADSAPYFTGSGTAALATLTSVARTLIAQTTQALMRTTGLGVTATGDSLATAASAAAARSTLGLDTANNPQFATIELGNASDTTLTRGAAGDMTVEGVSVLTTSNTKTVTGKRNQKRVVTVNAPGATPTTNTDNNDIAAFTGLAAAITSMTTNLSGTPVLHEMVEFVFTDNGTARAITWGASFSATTVALPTTTVISTMLRVLFQWDGSVWRCVAVA